jgi:outer membrane protein TolC
VNASLRYGVTAASDELQWENDADSLTVGVAVTVPVFTGGATDSAVRKARVEHDKTAIRVAQLRDEIRADVINTRLRLGEALQAVEAASRSVDSARRAYEIAEARVANRLATQLELSQSRLVYDEARLGYTSAVYDLLAARYDWERVTGTVPPAADAARQQGETR